MDKKWKDDMLMVQALLSRYVSWYSPPTSLEAPQYDLPDLRGRQSAQKIITFPLPLRGRQWKSTKSFWKQDKKATYDRCFQYNENSDVIFHEELCIFAFRRLSEKEKKPKTLRSLRLCGEQLFVEDPFRVTIKPPFLEMVIDCWYN